MLDRLWNVMDVVVSDGPEAAEVIDPNARAGAALHMMDFVPFNQAKAGGDCKDPAAADLISYEFDMVNLAVSESVVLTERIDRVGGGGGVPVAPVPVMGRFEVQNEKITAWYDYFDTALVGKMLSGESVDGLTPS